VQVVSYLATLSAKLLSQPHEHNAKVLTLKKFIHGVQACGDHGELSTDMVYQTSDVAMMLGWVHEHGKKAPHLKFRQTILDKQHQMNARVVIADSNLFLYKDLENPYNYLRYSFDGVFPDTGEYCDAEPDPAKWQTIKTDLRLDIKDWRNTGNHILLCLQRDGGWSMLGFDVLDWVMITIKRIREFCDRPIRIRPHPGDKKAGRYCQRIIDLCKTHGIKDVELSSPGVSLLRDFKHCWAVVNHNSSPAVAAAMEGIPVFVTDPVRSQAREVSNHDLALIENPQLFDRLAWAQRISQFHWNYDDLASGRCWQHMKKWAKK
jgi:hypothetical protein